MAVSKRLRFEILRRDNHTCQYCGEKAPNVTLHVDHVKPKALGGTDGPDNLVAACKDCNAGKTSGSLDAPIVEAIAQRNLDWEVRAATLNAQMRGTLERDRTYADAFKFEWEEWGGSEFDLPDGWNSTLINWSGMGVPYDIACDAVGVAMRNNKIAHKDKFVYVCGIVWRQIKACGELTPVAVELFTQSDLEKAWGLAFEAGMKRGAAQAESKVA